MRNSDPIGSDPRLFQLLFRSWKNEGAESRGTTGRAMYRSAHPVFAFRKDRMGCPKQKKTAHKWTAFLISYLLLILLLDTKSTLYFRYEIQLFPSERLYFYLLLLTRTICKSNILLPWLSTHVTISCSFRIDRTTKL